jgi:hypothetical protein
VKVEKGAAYHGGIPDAEAVRAKQAYPVSSVPILITRNKLPVPGIRFGSLTWLALFGFRGDESHQVTKAATRAPIRALPHGVRTGPLLKSEPQLSMKKSTVPSSRS